MITTREALDWELINPIELKYLIPAEQDIIIEVRDKQYSNMEKIII